MAKVKYYYDSETLSYRPISSGKGLKISNLLLFLISSLLFGIIALLTLLNTNVIKTPKEILYKSRKYTTRDLKYWSDYDIDKETLEKMKKSAQEDMGLSNPTVPNIGQENIDQQNLSAEKLAALFLYKTDI